jgi:hypothetical protein
VVADATLIRTDQQLSDQDANRLIRDLAATGDVDYVQPNYNQLDFTPTNTNFRNKWNLQGADVAWSGAGEGQPVHARFDVGHCG